MFSFSINIKTLQGRELIAPFSMSLTSGDRVAIIGEEGCGKSLLLKIISGIKFKELIIEYQESQHHVTAFVEQEIPENKRNLTLLEFVIEEDWDRYANFAIHFKSFFPEWQEEAWDRPLHTFSGGEQVKIQILRMLVLEADLILMDEPTNNLDLESIYWLESWILSCDKMILFVSHDHDFIHNTANKIIHLEHTMRKTKAQSTVWDQNLESYLVHRGQAINNHNRKVASETRQQKIKDEKWQRQYNKVSHQLQHVNRQDPGLQEKMKILKSTRDRYDRNEQEHAIDDTKRINLFFDNQPIKKKIISLEVPENRIEEKILGTNYKLTIHPQEKVVLVGSNGIGKTTLLKEFVEQLQEKLTVSYMGQDYQEQINYNQSALEFCEATSENEKEIATHLASLKLSYDEMHQPMHTLSGGQKAHVLLLKLVLDNPDIIILDEPTRNLSVLSQEIIFDMLRNYRGSILAISHDRQFINHVFDTIYEVTNVGLNQVYDV